MNSYNGKPPAQNAPNSEYATYTQAQQMLATHSTEKGEWYYRPDQPDQPAVCNSEPRWFFAVPGEPLPGSTLTPVSVAELDTVHAHHPGRGPDDPQPGQGTDLLQPAHLRPGQVQTGRSRSGPAALPT